MFQDIRVNKVKDDGTKLEIRVGFYNGKFTISDVGVTPKGKRKINYIMNTLSDNYSYRALNNEGREKMKTEVLIKTCGIEPLNEALTEAWESLKPKLLEAE